MTERAAVRIQSVDLLRGLVMVVMAIDHIRDYSNFYSQHFQPEDLAHTYPAMFFTRWMTHYCAPVFVFLAGTSAWLAGRRRTPAALSRLLLTRGVWLVVVELTIVQIGVQFNFRWDLMIWQVIGVIGCSMILLAALIHLPWRVVLAASVLVIAGHNLLDPVAPRQFGGYAWLWHVVHGPPTLVALAPGHTVLISYPLIPWMFVLSAGYCFGGIFELAPDARRRMLLMLGSAMTIGFVVVRAINGYGDPAPWSAQPRGVMTLLSFLSTTKYPPSLDFLLMTLGPAVLFLAACDRLRLSASNPLAVFGRVPFFYYVCHWYLLHSVVMLLGWFRYGRAGFLRQLMPPFDPGASGVPADYGYSLATSWAIWALVIVLLYPVCLWYSRLKATSSSPVFSYL
jgi:uncharacterized membrane protein